MVSFDLSELINKSGLSTSTKKIQDLLYDLSSQTQTYLENVLKLRSGIKPDEGYYISNSEISNDLSFFVRDMIISG